MTVTEKPDGPQTFEALLGRENGTGVKPLPVCSRCGNPATHRVKLTVSKPNRNKKRGDGEAPSVLVTSHGNDLCEPCGVAVFASFRKAIR